MSQNGICSEPVNIKYVTEKSHKKMVNYIKTTLYSIVGAEQLIYWALKIVE